MAAFGRLKSLASFAAVRSVVGETSALRCSAVGPWARSVHSSTGVLSSEAVIESDSSPASEKPLPSWVGTFGKVKETYDLSEAVAVALKKAPSKNFVESFEIHLKLNFNPRATNESVRGVISLPHGTGRVSKVAVFARGDKADAARAAGADVVGDEDLQKSIQAGDFNFDRVLATPDMMGIVGKVARILGPRGLMPNPKLGTLTLNIAEAVKAAKAGQLEFRVDKTGVIHASVGKVDFPHEKIAENVAAFYDVVAKARPPSVKGAVWVKTAHVTTTMGKSYNVNLASLEEARTKRN